MTVPSPSDAADEANLVYIPKARAEALAFILKAVTWKANEPKSRDKIKKSANNKLDPKSKAKPSNKNPATQAADTDEREHAKPTIELRSGADSGTSTIDEIIDSAKCYQLEPPVLQVLYKSLVDGRWDPSIIFAAAIISGLDVNAQYFSTRLVADGIQGCNPWALQVLLEKTPDVYKQLLALFARWEAKFPKFKALALTTMLADNADHFGRRCTPATCKVVAQWGGQWAAFHADVLHKEIFPFACQTPGLMGTTHGLERLCAKAVPCPLCATRVAASARTAWRCVMERNDWCLVEVSGNPQNRKLEKSNPAQNEAM